MSTRVVDRVDDWDSRPFSGGYGGLHELADQDFSGVIRAEGAELYMIKGAVVGMRQGSIEDFESASGTLYESPSPALPLLGIMQERSDEVRDKFYTEKTSISDVDTTLADGGFTGYIELSENVLSGDYYQVYHAGESMSVAFVGESKRLMDGNEAFETADDEVGIYEVRPVAIDPIEVPEPAEPMTEETTETGPSGATPTDQPESGTPTQDPAGTEPVESADTTTQQATQQQREATRQVEQQAETRQADSDRQQSSAQTTAGTDKPQTEPGHIEEPQSGQARQQEEPDQQEPANEQRTGQQEPDDQRRTQSTGETERSSVEASGTVDEYADPADRSTDAPARSQNTKRADQQQRRSGDGPGFQPSTGGQSRGRTTEQQVHTGGPSAVDESSLDLETRAVPSLDPAYTSQPEETGNSGPEPVPERTQPAQEPTTQSSEPPTQQTETTARADETQSESPQQQESSGESPTQQPSADTERIEELESEIEERDDRIEQLETELDEETAEREELEAELETVRSERDELESEVTELRDELERLETELGAATDAERRMTASEALSGTDIFVRYHSKGDATLEKAHDGSHRRDDVNGNLRLEKHTQFEAETVAVGGQTYEEFLEGTLEYQFVEWVVRELLFEIRDTGHTKALKDLYDVLPAIDRAELSGVVDVVYAEEGQETRSQESFDVVLRNRMGSPLLVANLNDSREATTESMMENLITAAERVGQSNDAFSGALFVTESFFEPGALECASDATKGGLLSRDKRKSFVNLSRKRGYHLCLVEARNENFHLAVPEL